MSHKWMTTDEVPRLRQMRSQQIGEAVSNAARGVVACSPFRCRMWTMHERLADHVTEESCRIEIESFVRQGQLIPVLGRLLCGDSEHDVELIYGARRLFVARHLNMPLKVELRDLSDREALIAMDIENRHRADVSPYERGLSFARWLRAGYFDSQEDVARALKISPSQVSRLLKLAQLPSVVMNAFEDPLQIREGWGLDLFRGWQKQQQRPLIAQRARSLAEKCPRPSARDVYAQLLAPAAENRRSRTKCRDEVVKGIGGRSLFRIRYQLNAVALVLPAKEVSAQKLERIRSSLAEILQCESP